MERYFTDSQHTSHFFLATAGNVIVNAKDITCAEENVAKEGNDYIRRLSAGHCGGPWSHKVRQIHVIISINL